jgi:outer membrane protein OmpA-like peptidoglycan-associated protein
MGSEVAARAIPSALERERQRLAGRAFAINLVHYGADVSVDDYDALIAKIDAALDNAPPERVRATLYSNQHDLALQASAVITGKHRAGRHGAQGDPPVYRASLEAAATDLNGDPSHSTVDVSLLSGKLFSRGFNHALFQETPEMLGDIACFMRGSRIDDRGLERRDPSDGRGEYFILAAGKKSAICGGPAWEIGELDCDSWFEMAAERLGAVWSRNREERLKECRDEQKNPKGDWRLPQCGFEKLTITERGKELGRFEVYFDLLGSSAVSENVLADIDAALETLPADVKIEDLWFEVTGHTDTKNTEEFNLLLSERRALAMREVLKSRGAVESQIETDFVGESQLKVSTPDGVEERMNRRAVIRFGQRESFRTTWEFRCSE